MCRSRIKRDVNSGGARWPRGLAGLISLVLFSTLEIGRCNGRVLQANPISRQLAETETTPPSAAVSSSSGRSLEHIWWIFLAAPAFFVLLVLFTIVCFRSRIEKRRNTIATKEIVHSKSPWKFGLSRTMRHRIKKITITELPLNTREELEHECEEFSNVIGSSEDSIVFKGTRDSGAQIAVARIQIPALRWSGSNELYFLRKVKDLARMKHANVVNLLAYCAEDEPFERMLVFEYAPNGTVHEHLHSSGSQADFLDWSTRMKILMGTAYGLNYMHTELDPPATHKKFDSTCVYLTEGFSAKVAACGMARLSTGSRSLARRESFAGLVKSVGYEDWEKYRLLTKPESNIHGFGLFVLEMISGRRTDDGYEGSILQWASEYMVSPEKYWNLVDPLLASHDGEQLAALVDLVKLCTKKPPCKRPTMAKVTEFLAAALKMSQADASLGSSGKIDFKSSPLTWAKLELLTSESGLNSAEEDDERSEVTSSSTFPLLAGGPSSPKTGLKTGNRSPRTSSSTVGSSSGGDLPDSHPLEEVVVTITSTQVKQFHQSDSKSFER